MNYFFYQLKNHINRDPLSDWFEITNRIYHSYDKDKKNSFQIELEKKKNVYITKFIDNLREDVFYENLTHRDIKSKIKNKEECIIFGGNLYHSKYNIHVKPDLIMHRSKFKQYFPEVICDIPEYIIIDILYKNIHFNSTKTDILNQGNIYYHKCKILVASEVIGNKKTGFFFGKEYRHKNIPLNKKETIGHFPLNKELKISIREAIEWLNNLNENYDKWIIYPKPSIKELYPNMNRKMGVWLNEKTILAELIKEITLVWNISYNKRCVLLEKGISCWDDPILLRNVYPLQIRDNFRLHIQKKMIRLNSQEEILIEPRKIKNYDFLQIIKDQSNSIILDIESVVDLEEKDSYFYNKESINTAKICIIGTILNKEDYIFKDFTIKYLKEEEERKIICYWIDYLNKNFKGKIKVYHWGNAEKVYVQYMKDKFPELIFPEFEMIDLLHYFKLEPINIKGCFGYGLKEIVKQLYNLKLIENQWEDETNGLDAMIQLKKTSVTALEKNIPIKRFHEIKRIIYYNYMDCRVIVDILKMLEGMI